MKRWIGQYQSVGERPLTEDEVEQLRKAVRRPRYLVAPAWIIGIAGIPIAFMGMMILDDLGLIWLGVTFAILLMTLMVVLPLKLRDARKQAKAAKIDLKVGVVEIFEVPTRGVGETIPPRFDEPDDDWDDDPDNPPYELDSPPRGRQIEVLKGTGMWLTEGSKPVKGYRTLYVSSVAEASSPASEAAFPQRFDYNDILDAAEAERHLTDEEREELRGFIKTMPRFPYFYAFMTFYLFFGLAAGIMNSSWLNTIRVICFAALAVAYVYGWFKFMEAFKGTRDLKRDLKRGIVLRRDTSKLDDQSAWSKHRSIEVLPRSELVWTNDGKPATWRKYK